MDQRFVELQQVMENLLAVRFEAMCETLERKMLLALEAWSKRGGTLEEGGRSVSTEHTVTDKGKQPMAEEVEWRGSTSLREKWEVPLFDMRLRKLEIPIFKGEIGEDPFG